ncbi:TOMM precursor leader peptide-binding protein [Aquimarina sp. RZ0]|uniref:TOMM precursor leader peptide-binding protein n=1 Tax=Aquimarina sp. RZ0 TaxID=2607730 RepID=UPI0011F359E7|nr:TOMM precursor leader peptide-binding protein [Aquimarina sp. RZ0]KAA1243749.1 TOMM precursor leader peptide-binding protein [Aquimarina sp. RZ0]
MDTQNLILHPDTDWVKIDENRIQLRQPDGTHITFDKHATDISNALTALRSTEMNDVSVDEDIMKQLKELLDSKGLLVQEDYSSVSQFQRLMDLHGTSAGKIDLESIPTSITFLGDGKLASLTKESLKKSNIKITDNQDSSSLIIAISDQEDHKFLRKANATAVKKNQPILFFRWAQRKFVIGPFVIPKQTACLECAYKRELGSSLFPDELKAYSTGDAKNSPSYEGGLVLDNMASALITRHIMTILDGNYDLAGPSNIVKVDPVYLNIKYSPILRLPRCGVCNNTEDKPKRTIREQFSAKA